MAARRTISLILNVLDQRSGNSEDVHLRQTTSKCFHETNYKLCKALLMQSYTLTRLGNNPGLHLHLQQLYLLGGSATLAITPDTDFLLHCLEPFIHLLELLLHQPQFVYHAVELHSGLGQSVLVNLPVLTEGLQHSVFCLGDSRWDHVLPGVQNRVQQGLTLCTAHLKLLQAKGHGNHDSLTVHTSVSQLNHLGPAHNSHVISFCTTKQCIPASLTVNIVFLCLEKEPENFPIKIWIPTR